MRIINKNARFNYTVSDTIEAGINLTGAEVKAIRLGHVDLTGSFARIRDNQAYLFNAQIFPYAFARPEGYDLKRIRKLLLHKKEITSIKAKMEGGNLTLVPLALYTSRNLIKVELALARGKKEFQKRDALKKRDMEREVELEFKAKLT